MKYLRITSPSNTRIKKLAAIRNKGPKGHSLSFLIEGAHLLEAALSAGVVIREAYFTSGFASKSDGRRLLGILSKQNTGMYEVTDAILRRIAETETPQGVISLVDYKPLELNDLAYQDNPLFTVIDGVQDPGNLGTIIRTADAAGSDAVVVLPGTCDAFMPKVLRSTAGSIFQIPILHANAPALMTWLHKNRIRLAAASAHEGGPVFRASLHGPIALLFGNEARGVSRKMRESADLLLRVPIYGGAESLNVAAAAAVCLYEAVRQRRWQPGTATGQKT